MLVVMMQQLLYKWPKGVLSVQDHRFYQSIKHELEVLAGTPSSAVNDHPRDVSVTVYNPTEETITLQFTSPYRPGISEKVMQKNLQIHNKNKPTNNKTPTQTATRNTSTKNIGSCKGLYELHG